MGCRRPARRSRRRTSAAVDGPTCRSTSTRTDRPSSSSVARRRWRRARSTRRRATDARDGAGPVGGALPAESRRAGGAARFDSLTSWTRSADAGVKYFSGTATYAKDVTVPAAAFAPGSQIEIDLGAVKEIAELSVNGTPVGGVLWKPPYRADVTRALQRRHEPRRGARHQPLAEPHDRRPSAGRDEDVHLHRLPPVHEGLAAARVGAARAGAARRRCNARA